MKCDKCENYHIHPSMVNEGYYTACKSRELTRYEIEQVMDDDKKHCKAFIRINVSSGVDESFMDLYCDATGRCFSDADPGL